MGLKIAGYRNLPWDLVGHILSFCTLLPKYGHLSRTLYEFSKFNTTLLDIHLLGNLLLQLEEQGRNVENSNRSYEVILYAIHKYELDDIRCHIMLIARINRFLYRIPKSLRQCSIMTYMYANNIDSIRKEIYPQIGWINNKIYNSSTNILGSYYTEELYLIFHSTEAVSIITRLNLLDLSHKYYLLFEWMQLYHNEPLTIGELILKYTFDIGIEAIQSNRRTKDYILMLLHEIPKDKRLMNLQLLLL